ncbi:LysR family transcriptional regulator [Paraburkholderia unamae]|uniref:LysR family transcriptional regulator n=1 Tax=Paraburkholderia unamae TaxID=219649 RepID=A0ABX5KUX4_9BURK|nr:LysR family transcriptional regulator [Paraburkholderia unamae]PVX85020.1 LysR family transcriptional regulator [Paraburkholderia unamae]RAR65887.1 LysR family transcriptional regulator [Paraburkholderia unamae]CAG9266933.1 Transcriptional regulator, LysR family [Paraburkholderia unamae]
MRLSRIDLNLFIVFEAVYRTRNLTRAAELLFITQPAVSNALARMRKTFDDPLFVSTPAGMMPTPVSENIIVRVREALQLLDSSTHAGERFDPAASQRTFRLSMNDLTEALLLPALEEVLQRHAPGIRIESYFTTRRDVPEALASGAVHLAIDAPLIDDPYLEQEPLGRDRYACMLRQDHPFAKKKLTIDDYLRFGHIHVSSRRQGPGLVDTELNKLGVRRTIQTRVQHYLVAPLIAMRTDLMLTAPLMLLKRYDARILALPFALPDLETHGYWHRSVSADPAHRWLREQIGRLMRKTRQ